MKFGRKQNEDKSKQGEKHEEKQFEVKVQEEIYREVPRAQEQHETVHKINEKQHVTRQEDANIFNIFFQMNKE